MLKMGFIIKILILLSLVVWMAFVYFCMFSRAQYEDMDIFTLVLGVFLQLCFFVSTYLFLFQLKSTLLSIRESFFPKMQVTFLLFPFFGWLLALSVVISGLHGRTLDPFYDDKLRYIYWVECVFTLSPCLQGTDHK